MGGHLANCGGHIDSAGLVAERLETCLPITLWQRSHGVDASFVWMLCELRANAQNAVQSYTSEMGMAKHSCHQ